jgi:tRNA(Arg) A34 adenosine deaminase TadA
METRDQELVVKSIAVAKTAREAGNHPFGAVLADDGGQVILKAGNTVVTAKDVTAHAELNLVRMATEGFGPQELAGMTLYASTEPCAMCASAIYWSQIGRVVFGLSQETFNQLLGESERHGKLHLSCREVFERGEREVDVLGPVMEEQAAKVHAGFW